jgi:hypothetical protein
VNNRKLVVMTVCVMLLVISTFLLGNLFIKYMPHPREGAVPTEVGQVLWHDRNFDVFLQGFIIFAGALGVLALFRGEDMGGGRR